MAIDPQALLDRRFPVLEQTYTARDTMLYALGIGLGADPLDAGSLAFVTEDNLRALPKMINILGFPGFWAREPDTGIDWRRLLHAEQSFVLHEPVPASGSIRATNRVSGIYDKGAAKGALLVQERSVTDAASGDALATVTQVTMLRGDGGRGGLPGSPTAPHPIPERAPDAVCDLATRPEAALIYPLSGDYNPLHANPAVAQAAGFSRPILHGLCTMGIACHAGLRALLGYEADAVRGMRVRFTAPVLPGETVRTELWEDGRVISLRSSVIERETVVLNAGRIDLA